MINDSYTALDTILSSNTAITSLLGFYEGSTIPLIKGGVLAETETQLPAITYRVDTGARTQVLDNQFFIVNCYAATERESYLLAKTIVDELNECSNVIEGYNMRTTCRIIGDVPDPLRKEINTPIEFRIVNI